LTCFFFFFNQIAHIKHLEELSLAGQSEWSDGAILHVARSLPKLCALDFSRCEQITDMTIGVICDSIGSRLVDLRVAFCRRLTDDTLSFVRLHCFQHRAVFRLLDVTRSYGFSATACRQFIQFAVPLGVRFLHHLLKPHLLK
jgi:hypothetical protein